MITNGIYRANQTNISFTQNIYDIFHMYFLYLLFSTSTNLSETDFQKIEEATRFVESYMFVYRNSSNSSKLHNLIFGFMKENDKIQNYLKDFFSGHSSTTFIFDDYFKLKVIFFKKNHLKKIVSLLTSINNLFEFKILHNELIQQNSPKNLTRNIKTIIYYVLLNITIVEELTIEIEKMKNINIVFVKNNYMRSITTLSKNIKILLSILLKFNSVFLYNIYFNQMIYNRTIYFLKKQAQNFVNKYTESIAYIYVKIKKLKFNIRKFNFVKNLEDTHLLGASENLNKEIFKFNYLIYSLREISRKLPKESLNKIFEKKFLYRFNYFLNEKYIFPKLGFKDENLQNFSDFINVFTKNKLIFDKKLKGSYNHIKHDFMEKFSDKLKDFYNYSENVIIEDFKHKFFNYDGSFILIPDKTFEFFELIIKFIAYLDCKNLFFIDNNTIIRDIRMKLHNKFGISYNNNGNETITKIKHNMSLLKESNDINISISTYNYFFVDFMFKKLEEESKSIVNKINRL
ncbi:hypothetical protein H311_01806 [Anncaliia algerae PRA109]|nr:hypothetical protein H311_01806 [Anncaliia algerae PRA109]